MMDIPMTDQIYRHFRGGMYRIITCAVHAVSGEDMVVYQALYGDLRVYVQELSLFMGSVDREKYPDADQDTCFRLATELVGQGEPAAARQEPVPALGGGGEGSRNTEEETEPPGPAQEVSADPTEEEPPLDPFLLDFLDADTYRERLNLLAALHVRLTDDMVNTMAVSLDVEIPEGDIEERYEALKNCLLTLDKYECNRIR